MLRSLCLITLTATFAAATASGAEVYRFTDENGNVLYTDKPSTLPAERLNIKSQKTDVVALEERRAAEMKRLQESASARERSAAARQDEQEAANLTAKDKAERCVQARERYDTYMRSPRLYEQLPNGERRYLTDVELEAARASAKATMDVMCQ